MLKSVIKLAMIVLTLMFPLASHADDRATPEEAEKMVHRVISDIKATSKDAVIAEINSLSDKYKDRELYVTIMDLNGNEIAHGANKKMQGVNLMELRDTDNKYYIKERIAIVKEKGKGWQDYKFVNPVTKQIEQKSMYFERLGDLIVSCGVYKKQ